VAASLVALFICGAAVTRITSKTWWFSGFRQLVLGSAAASLTYAIGNLVGTGLN
jgi:VIT1/CCC1 family predicted Fe2+/Mn2+ transporter